MNTSPMHSTPGSGIASTHPLYQEFQDDWRTMRDTYRGSRVVKAAGTLYLPPTSGMIADGMGSVTQAGSKAYQAYKARAHFPSIVKDAVQAMIGVMHQKPPTIELPAALEPLREASTLRHEPLEALLRRINTEQLISGRLGLLLDLPEEGQSGTGVLPYVATYVAENLINWDEGRRDGIVVDNLNLIVLDESEYERRSDFSWEMQKEYRVLMLASPNDNAQEQGNQAAKNIPVGKGTYQAGVFREAHETFSPDKMVVPQIRGNTLDEIPFVVINDKDVVPEPEEPPLLGLADLALTIYRGEADYRHALFMQGQDTLVVIGSAGEDDSELRVGADARIDLPIGGDAKFIGVDSGGLPEMRQALENDRQLASQKGGELMDSVSRERESGEALHIRVAARTASLTQIAKAGAFGLERLLTIAARWVGADENQVKVEANLDFIDDRMAGKELIDLMTAKSLGAPISLKSIHEGMQAKGLTELSLEEETAEIEGEAPIGGATSEGSPEPDDDRAAMG